MQRHAIIHILSVLCALAAFGSSPRAAQAGGYDTPILYSARHMGMGGTAVGYVNDPSSLFHNPAGLAGSEKLTLLADFSLLVGGVKGSPQADTNIDSETTIAPLFLVGVAVPITEWMSAGFAIFPVASAGASYEYDFQGNAAVDSTTLVFIEATPGIAFKLPQGVRLGLGYRVTYMSLDRSQTFGDSDPNLEFNLTGVNWFSFRAGAQWTPVDRGLPTEREHFSIGLNYRHRTEVDISADEGRALSLDATDLSSTFVLPARLTAGIRGDYGRFGAAFDFEYGFQSQNEASYISGKAGPLVLSENPGMGESMAPANVFDWDDAVTLRFGAEARLLEKGQLALRLGYIFDARTSQKAYPTPFGTPPAPTNSITAGCGYDAGDWQANIAYAYRFGGATVTPEDIASAEQNCSFCGKPGDYEMSLHGIYADFSIQFGGGAAPLLPQEDSYRPAGR